MAFLDGSPACNQTRPEDQPSSMTELSGLDSNLSMSAMSVSCSPCLNTSMKARQGSSKASWPSSALGTALGEMATSSSVARPKPNCPTVGGQAAKRIAAPGPDQVPRSRRRDVRLAIQAQEIILLRSRRPRTSVSLHRVRASHRPTRQITTTSSQDAPRPPSAPRRLNGSMRLTLCGSATRQGPTRCSSSRSLLLCSL